MAVEKKGEGIPAERELGPRVQLLVAGAARAVVFPLSRERRTRVGRGPGMDLALDDPAVAEEQLSLRVLDSGRLEVVDLGGGARLNDVQVSGRTEARAGDQIVVGSHRLLVQVVSRAPLAPHPPVWPHWAFQARLGEELDRAASAGSPLSLLLVQSTASRAEGPRALVHSLVPPSAFAALGALGEDALEVLWPGLSPEGCARALGQLASGLGRSGHRFQLGHASFPTDGASGAELWERALARTLEGAAAEEPDEPLFLDPVMVRLSELLEHCAGFGWPLLLRGEPGVGKRTLARVLHQRGSHRDQPFVATDEESLEVGGAGGPIEAGVLYVAAPNGLTARCQALLREWSSRGVAKERGVLVVGVQPEVKPTGRSRADRQLWEGFSEVLLEIPALRDRPAEILPLAEAFLSRWRRALGRSQLSLGDPARRLLSAHAWPANVREIKNAMAWAALATESGEVDATFLAGALRGEPAPGAQDRVMDLRDTLKATEKDALLRSLAQSRWNVTEAARQLGLPRRTVVYRMRRLGLRRPGR